jgi:hypothetical protein
METYANVKREVVGSSPTGGDIGGGSRFSDTFMVSRAKMPSIYHFLSLMQKPDTKSLIGKDFVTLLMEVLLITAASLQGVG